MTENLPDLTPAATRSPRSETRQRTAHLPTVRATPDELAAIQAVFAASGFRSFGAFARASLAGSRSRSARSAATSTSLPAPTTPRATPPRPTPWPRSAPTSAACAQP